MYTSLSGCSKSLLDSSACSSCSQTIKDKFIIEINNKKLHQSCAVCSMCSTELNDSCFITNEQKFVCRLDYYKQLSPRCIACKQPLLTNELCFHAQRKVFQENIPNVQIVQEVYHQSCFVCTMCRLAISPGHPYAHDPHKGNLLCRKDFLAIRHTLNPNFLRPFYKDYSETGDWSNSEKRQRTILTNSQRMKFQKIFDSTPRPSKKIREALSVETGLSVRVIQVWFQNQRAREKKLQAMGLSSSDHINQQENPEEYLNLKEQTYSQSYSTNGLKRPHAGSLDDFLVVDEKNHYHSNSSLNQPRSTYNTNPLSPTHHSRVNPC